MKNFLKYFSIPAVLFAGSISFAIYMAWTEEKFKNTVVERALQGNKYAIEILQKYEKPWKLDQRVVYAAIEGNKYAIEILAINP
jgi:hypothetical protein